MVFIAISSFFEFVRLIGDILPAQRNGGIYQSDVAVSLRKVAQQPFGFKIDILAQQSQVIAVAQNLLEHLLGLFFFSDFIKRPNQPEGANCKRGLGLSKVILVTVAIHEPV